MLIFLIALIPAISRGQTQPSARAAGADPKAESAIPAILAAFDKYEVVAMPEDHGLKDLDDLIFALIRNPAFPAKVNDVVVECGNSRYQSVLDRYIAGDDAPFSEARKCGETRRSRSAACGDSDSLNSFTPCCAQSTRSCRPKSAFAYSLEILRWTGTKSRVSKIF
jgi:hypothetical protein